MIARLICQMILLVVTVSLPAKSIYVSPAGKDSNSGLSPEQALKTIAAALPLTKPGDEIRLLQGTFHGTTRIENLHGMPENPITIMSDAQDSSAFAVIDGGVRLVNGVAPSGTVANDLPNYGFEVRASSWLIFKNLKFRNCWAHVIVIRNSSYISVTGCDIRSGKRTIYARDGSHHVLVDNNYWEQDQRVWDTWDWASLHHGVGGDPAGVVEMEHFNGALLHPKESGGSLVMRSNIIKNVFNGFRTKPSRINEDSNIEVYDNLFINVRDNAFEPERFAWNIHFYHNVIYNCHKSFSIDNIQGGWLYIYGNVQSQKRNPHMGPHVYGGSADGITGIWKFKGPNVLTWPCYAFNNSFYTHATAFKEGEATNQQMKHYNNAYEFFTSATRAGSFGLDNWHDSFKFDHDAINRTWPPNITDHQQEQHGILTNLLFEDGAGTGPATGQDFRMQAGSPAIDGGKVLLFPEFNWTQRFTGSAPDIGAFEGEKLVEGPPFRFREPPGGVSYKEKPRIVRHRVNGQQLQLYFSAELNPVSVTVTSIYLFENHARISVVDVAFPEDNFSLLVTASQPLHESALAIYLEPLPVGVNGETATHWASTIPIADKSLVTSVEDSDDIASQRDETDEEVRLVVYPNPFNEQALVMIKNPVKLRSAFGINQDTAELPLRVYDVRGRLIQEYLPTAVRGAGAYRIDSTSLATGVYFATVRMGKNILVAKFMVLK